MVLSEVAGGIAVMKEMIDLLIKHQNNFSVVFHAHHITVTVRINKVWFSEIIHENSIIKLLLKKGYKESSIKRNESNGTASVIYWFDKDK